MATDEELLAGMRNVSATTTDTARKAARVATEVESLARSTAAELHRQKKDLEHVERDLEVAENDLATAKRVHTSLYDLCWACRVCSTFLNRSCPRHATASREVWHDNRERQLAAATCRQNERRSSSGTSHRQAATPAQPACEEPRVYETTVRGAEPIMRELPAQDEAVHNIIIAMSHTQQYATATQDELRSSLQQTDRLAGRLEDANVRIRPLARPPR